MKFSTINAILLIATLFFSCNTAQETSNEENKDSLKSSGNTGINSVETDSSSLSASIDSTYSFQDTDSTGKYGLKNKKDELILKPMFDAAGEFYDGKFPVIKDGKHGFSDIHGKVFWLTDYSFLTQTNEMSGEVFITGSGEGLVAVKNQKGLCGYMNYSQKLIIDFLYEDAMGFSCGLAGIMKKGKYGFIDKKGKINIDFIFDGINSFRNNLACIVEKTKYGYINTKGEIAIPIIYSHAVDFSEGLAFATFNDNYTDYFYIDTTGKVIIKGPFDQAVFFRNGEATVEIKGKCYLINKTGKKLKQLEDGCFEGGC